MWMFLSRRTHLKSFTIIWKLRENFNRAKRINRAKNNDFWSRYSFKIFSKIVFLLENYRKGFYIPYHPKNMLNHENFLLKTNFSEKKACLFRRKRRFETCKRLIIRDFFDGTCTYILLWSFGFYRIEKS